MLAALVGALALILLFLQNRMHRTDMRSAVALERARQDLLLTRLASRTPGEFVAAAQAAGEMPTPTPKAPAEVKRYLYDETGMTRIEAPADMNDPAYENAGSF